MCNRNGVGAYPDFFACVRSCGRYGRFGCPNSASFSTDTIYQIVTDRFYDGDPSNNPSGDIFDKNDPRKYHGGDWEGITDKIEDGYLTNMGITAIWISSPVENITTVDPSNNSAAYHGYWGRDFFRTNEFFGSMDDFTELVDTAHNNDIKIVIDFAPNHTSTAEYGEMVFPEDGRLYRDGELISGFKTDTQGIFNHESWTDFSTWENSIYHSMYGLADLNQMNGTVDNYLKDSIDMWLDLGVDGIRVDAVKHMPMGWQSNWLSDIYEEHETFVFGEWFNGGTGNDPEMTGFANESGMGLLEFRLANAIRGAVGDLSMSMQDLYNVMVDRETSYKEINDQVTFVDNHDMSRFMTLANGNARALENAYVLMMTSSGIPTIYYGSEQYATGASDPYNRTGFGNSAGTVYFGTAKAQIVSWSDSMIQVLVPNVTAGYYDIEVVTSAGVRAADYAQYKVLSGSQTAVRFFARNATTSFGQNIYIVGNCVELGNWDTNKAVGPFFNATGTIATYPDWFFDISVPEGYNLEYKFIKKDAAGNVVWESGMNHTYTVPTGTTGEVSVYFNN